jgi:hypothetical protein
MICLDFTGRVSFFHPPTRSLMTKPTITVLLMIAALSLASAQAGAQTPVSPERFFTVNVGAQPQSRTVDALATTELYEQTAEFAAATTVGSGVFFDIAGGQRISPELTIGVGYSYFSSTGSASGTATIPDPLFGDRPTTMPIELSDLKKTEQFINIQFVWFRPVRAKMDIAVAVGPSIAHVSQEFASGQLVEGTETVEIVPDSQGGWGFGVNVGGDLIYMLTPQYGVGVLARYTWASVGLPAADVTAGGFQIGGGLRVRF